MFFFSSEQFEGIEVEDVLDGLASPLLLFAQIKSKKDTLSNYSPFFSVDKADKKQKKNLCFFNHLGLSSTIRTRQQQSINLLKKDENNLISSFKFLSRHWLSVDKIFAHLVSDPVGGNHVTFADLRLGGNGRIHLVFSAIIKVLAAANRLNVLL